MANARETERSKWDVILTGGHGCSDDREDVEEGGDELGDVRSECGRGDGFSEAGSEGSRGHFAEDHCRRKWRESN